MPVGELDRRRTATLRGAEERARELGAPRADEPGERRRSRPRARRSSRRRRPGACRSRTVSSDRRVGRRRLLRRERRGERAAEHRLDQRCLRLRRGGRGADEPAVAQHGDRVRELEHLARGSARSRTIVVPPRDERADDLVQLLASRRALSAAVGSSMTISCASRESARRISTFCCSAVRSRPAGASPGQVEARRTRRARRTRASSWRPRSDAGARGSTPRKTFCATVSCGTTDGSCAIAATLCSSASRGERKETSAPSRRIRPAVGASAPETIRPSVDLPAPFSPTSACTEPAGESSETPSSAWTPPKCLATSRSSRYGRSRPVRRGGR